MRKLAFWAVVLLPLLGLAGMADARPFSARLSGGEEVPARETDARGAIQLKLNKEGTELEYRLRVSRIENVIGAHLHLGAVGVNGDVVVGLFEGPTGAGAVSGVLAQGTITAADLAGPLAGQSLSALIDAIERGDIYVNVHTDDGVEPVDTGAGDFPGGEIRGQVD